MIEPLLRALMEDFTQFDPTNGFWEKPILVNGVFEKVEIFRDTSNQILFSTINNQIIEYLHFWHVKAVVLKSPQLYNHRL